jgi:hypothetical protein
MESTVQDAPASVEVEVEVEVDVVDPPDRRRVIQLGGLGALAAAILAACGSDSKGSASDSSATTQTTAGSKPDASILRAASSIERLAVMVYQRAVDAAIVKSPAALEAVTLFLSQHQQHASVFDAETKKAGGTPFDQPNPALLQRIEAPLAAMKDENGALAIALQVEQAATATYYAVVGSFTEARLNLVVMSVGGVHARHAAVLAGFLNQPQVPRAFQTADGAVTATL